MSDSKTQDEPCQAFLVYAYNYTVHDGSDSRWSDKLVREDILGFLYGFKYRKDMKAWLLFQPIYFRKSCSARSKKLQHILHKILSEKGAISMLNRSYYLAAHKTRTLYLHACLHNKDRIPGS